MPAQSDYAIPAAWGKSPFEELELPSGGRCLAKRIDFEAIVAADLIDEFDKLSPVAEEQVIGPAKGKKPADRQPKKLTKKQQAEQAAEASRNFLKSSEFVSMVSLMGRLLPHLIVKPTIFNSMEKDPSGAWSVIPPDEREDGRVYSDSIPLLTKCTSSPGRWTG